MRLFDLVATAFALSLVALGAPACSTASCDVGSYRCEGNMLQECTASGWEDDTDCDAVALQCHAEMGHCMAMDSGM